MLFFSTRQAVKIAIKQFKTLILNKLVIPQINMAGIINITPDNFVSEVKESTVPVLVDFWAEWCGPCKMLGPILDELAEEKGDSCKIAKVNIDDCRDLAVEYGVKSIPMLLFFNQGEVKDEQVGLVNKETISSKLDAIA